MNQMLIPTVEGTPKKLGTVFWGSYPRKTKWCIIYEDQRAQRDDLYSFNLDIQHLSNLFGIFWNTMFPNINLLFCFYVKQSWRKWKILMLEIMAHQFRWQYCKNGGKIDRPTISFGYGSDVHTKKRLRWQNHTRFFCAKRLLIILIRAVVEYSSLWSYIWLP